MATLAALSLIASTGEAGPWVRKPGSTYTKLNLARFSADQSFNQGVDTGLQYMGTTVNLYNEIGLPYRLQLITDVPYVFGRNNSPQGVNYLNNTFGDARFELGHGLVEGLPLLLAVEAKLPFYSTVADDDETFSAFSATRESFPDAGDGNVDVTPKVGAGYSFHPIPAWVTAELGYRVRLDGFADGIFASLGGGVFVLGEHVALNMFSNAVFNVEDDPNPELRATREFVYVQGSVFARYQPWFEGLGLSVGVGWLPYTKNAAAGNDISVGLSYEQ
ncbi:MAG: hypothetical protein CMH57_02210 [Myxococcales bacterium]|nr:hypothetical protein [Myxococcales bacterium]